MQPSSLLLSKLLSRTFTTHHNFTKLLPVEYADLRNIKTCPKNADAIIIADNKPERLRIGENGDITAKYLWMLSPHITVLQLKGRIDREDRILMNAR
ncbi:unnamed protein product [marine sediment metagenome]|uniref:Uncharacterized protein n=1 Tax=marine sediment metagenome TaxID=412755 RepID=X1J0Z2_9ZZZZ